MTSQERQDLRRRVEELEDEPATSWRPKPGDVLVGEVVDLDTRSTEFDPAVPVVTLHTDEGERVAVWAFHTVLRSELVKIRPELGDWLAVKRLPDSDKGYKRYRVVPQKTKARAFAWDRVSVDGGDVAPEDRDEILHEEPKGFAKELVDGEDPLPF